MWVKIAPVPVTGQDGRYGINFPLRPGDTLFRYVYHLPYQASTTLHLKLPYPITNFAVMHPPSMSFKALRPDAFKSPGLAGGFRVEQALTTPLTGDVPDFKIAVGPPSGATHSGKILWLMLSEVIVILAVGAFVTLRARSPRTLPVD
jgi:hypothetical protein